MTAPQLEGRTAADVVHTRVSTVPATATVGELRAYFAESDSRQLALLVDGDRYAGSLSRADLPADADASAPAARLARQGPVIAPAAPAREAWEGALAQPSARLPVVDGDGALVGVVAINHARDGFCG
ncbi:MAG TPA: CBS domain-containing protein [Solirubrobacteraceae bacterium]|jgi:CBS domain-containing protein